jgi:serine/threonine protein kinase
MPDSTTSKIIDQIHRTGKYTVEFEIREGANGYSFKAIHAHLNKNVFLKVYNADTSASNPIDEPQTLIEITQNSSSLAHLVRVYDVQRLDDNYMLMATEFVEGRSLLEFINTSQFKLMDAIELAKYTIQGLSYLHNAGFVHRDIKPANILLSECNSRVIAKIGDFGSARLLPDANTYVTASKHSALYVPPEGWDTPSRYGIQSDIYQMGLVAWELLNGPLPYNNESYIDKPLLKHIRTLGLNSFNDLDDCDKSLMIDQCIARKAKDHSMLEMVSCQPYVPPRIRKAIRKATHPDLNKRYKSCFEFLNDLSAYAYPNWCEVDDRFSAEGWKGFDYLITTEYRKEAITGYQVYRRRTCSGEFRRMNKPFSDLSEAFEHVNGQ